MADAIAGRLTTVEVSIDNGTSWINLGGVIDASLSINIDELETTDHDSGGARTYIPNHHDATMDCSLRWEDGDAGQDIVLDAIFAKSIIDFRFRLASGVGNYQFLAKGFATSAAPSGPLDDTASFDSTFRLSGLTKAVQ